ncbi:MAG: hypothetical protein IJR85_05405 [Synergistaceae bacterium]|nr:hypothetical protein [Synergistaceae bacterium]
MAWYIFTYVTGLVEVTDFRAAYKITARVALTAIFFLGARITIAYDLKIYFLGVALIATGSILALNYLRFFDGLNFISRIGSLLLANGRYRNAYGFTHPNDAGIACCYFIIISLLYNMALETRTRNQYKNILMSQYIYILCIITFLMMMSTGSRSAITSLAMFLMVYFLLGMYKKNAVTANALLVVSIILVAFFAMIAIDWYFLIIQSGRLQNFMPIMKMSADELITGYGYIDYLGEGFLKWGSKLGFGKYLDSMYANVIISSGIVGFCLFFIPLTLSIMMFFRNVREMTKLQRAIGASFVQVMYYFMFEQHLYDFMWYSLVIWIISIIIMNEKAQTIKNNVASFTIQTRRTKICNGLC